MKERNIFWDNFKGILIFLVVFAHFLYAYRSLSSSFASHLVNFIYFFHMPAFVFTTGYFSRSENSNKPKAYLKLLVYYMIFNTILINHPVPDTEPGFLLPVFQRYSQQN